MSAELRAALERLAQSDERIGIVIVDVDRAEAALTAALASTSIDGVSGTGLDVLGELRGEITAIAMESVPRDMGPGALRYKRAVIQRLDFLVARLAAGAALAKDGEETSG